MAQHEPTRSYLVYHQHVLQENGNPVVFVDVTVSLQDFKLGHEDELFLHINKYSVDPDHIPYLPGQISEDWSSVATELARKVARSAIKKLIMMEADGRCVDNLQEVHFRVYPSGKVKLLGVNLLTRQQLGDDDYLNALRANHLVVAGLIRGLFISRTGLVVVPPDVNHLLELMETEGSFQDREMFISHASIVPFANYPGLYKYYHDLVKDPNEVATYETVSQVVGEDANWRNEVRDNHLLLETYNFFVGANPYEFSHQETATLTALALVNPQQAQHQREIINGKKMMTYLRNRQAHRVEALTAGYGTWNVTGIAFTVLHTELVTLVRFQLVVVKVQLILYRGGYLTRRALL